MATRLETEIGISANFSQVASKEGIVSSQNPREEMEIVRKAQNGDEGAFEALYIRYQRRVFLYNLRRLANLADAEDVTSEVFVKMAENLSRFQIQEKPFGAWVFRIAHNTLVSFRRSEKRTESQSTALINKPATDQFSNPQEFVENRLLIDQILSAVQGLPGPQREVTILRFVKGLSVIETSKITGKNEVSVKNTQHKAIMNLRSRLARDGFQDILNSVQELPLIERGPSEMSRMEKLLNLTQEQLDRLPNYLFQVVDLIRSSKTKEEVAKLLGKRVDIIDQYISTALCRLELSQTKRRSIKVK